MYSQLDTKWRDETLGSKGTIGEYGCTITSLANLFSLHGHNLNPSQVNQRLKEVSGYANGNLIIWSKINQAFPFSEFEWRGYSYENDRVTRAISENKGCLVEVDGKAIGGTGKHWVLFLGNKECFDPWTGKVRPTSDFVLTGYSAIAVKEAVSMSDPYSGLDLSNVESMRVAAKVWKDVADGKYVSKEEYAELLGSNKELQKQIAELKKGLGEANAELASAKEELLRVKKAHEEEVASQVDFGDDAARMEAKFTECKNQTSNLLSKLEAELKLPKNSDSVNERGTRVIDGIVSLRKEIDTWRLKEAQAWEKYADAEDANRVLLKELDKQDLIIKKLEEKMAKKAEYNLKLGVALRFIRTYLPQVPAVAVYLADLAGKVDAPAWVIPTLIFVGAVATAADKWLRELKK
jgi:hypothetical protein